MTTENHGRPWLVKVGTIVVAFLALADALGRLAGYASDSRLLWRMPNHDRNGHFGFALDLALALRDVDIFNFLSHLERAQVWPPLHGLVLAATMLAGGIDMKLAIVPSLAGWVATIVLVWLIGLRLFSDTAQGALAGALGVAFAIVSPGFRLITADVMLEGLGAGLSCFCIYSYLRAREAPAQRRWWRILAIALTTLYFEKYNYWLLTAAPLAMALLLDEPARARAILAPMRGILGVLRGELRQPLTWAFLVMLAVVIAIAFHGPLSVSVFSGNVSLYPPNNLLTLAYAFLFARIAIAWKRNRAPFDLAIGPALQQIAYWHVLPVMASLLIPKRLAPFLWFIGPTHHHGLTYNPWGAARWHWDGFASGFHVAPWSAGLVALGIVLALVGIVIRRADRPLRAVALVGLIGAAAVVLHPQQQLRFQTTVLPPLWMLAGAGWALLIGLLTARIPRLAAGAASAAAVGALYFAQSGYPLRAEAYQAAIHPRTGPSNFVLFDAYHPHLAGAQRVGFITTSDSSAFYRWTLAESCKCRAQIEQPFIARGADREQMRARTAAWLARTRADTIVGIVQPKDPTQLTAQDRMLAQFDALEQQTRFGRITTIRLPEIGSEITIWRRRDAGSRP